METCLSLRNEGNNAVEDIEIVKNIESGAEVKKIEEKHSKKIEGHSGYSMFRNPNCDNGMHNSN